MDALENHWFEFLFDTSIMVITIWIFHFPYWYPHIQLGYVLQVATTCLLISLYLVRFPVGNWCFIKIEHPINTVTTFKECSGLHGVVPGPQLRVPHGISGFPLTPHDKIVVNLDVCFTCGENWKQISPWVFPKTCLRKGGFVINHKIRVIW